MRLRLLTALGVLSSTIVLIPSAGGTTAQEAPPSFRSSAEVVVLDVVATDRRGRPIDDLRRDEISVSEDGKACEILSFRLVRAAHPPAPLKATAATAATPTEAATAGVSATPARASLVVLLFDRLTTKTAPLARSGALDLVSREFPADTWFAVMKIDYGVRLLAPFTTRPEELRRAILAATSGDPDVRGSMPPLSPPVGAVQPGQIEARPDPGSPRMPSLSEVAGTVGKEVDSLSRRVDGYDSLYAVLGLARSLAVVEGRKSVVYFAEAWHLPAGVQPVYDDAVSAANRANVAIHTVDARGLTSHKPLALTPIDSVFDRFTADYQRGSSTPLLGEAGGVPGNEPGLRSKMEPMEERLGGPRLERLAEDTGGLAIAGTNDLGAGLAGVAEDLRQYYEVVYSPSNTVLDGRFRRTSVEVSRPRVKLRTRSGYFATAGGAPALAAYELALMDALAADVPPNDLVLRTGVLHFAPKGGERECVVLAEVPIAEVQVVRDEAAGGYRGHLSLLGYIKDGSGKVVARLTHDWPIEVALIDSGRAAQATAVFRRAFSLAPGRYLLETAVQDRQSGAASVRRVRFVVPPSSSGLALGSVALLRSASAAALETRADDPLRVGDLLLFPGLGAPFVLGSSPELPVYVGVYPGAPGTSGTGGEPTGLTIELRRGAKVVARATPALAGIDATGRIPWLGGISADRLLPGAYDLVATAHQGGETVEERTTIEIVRARAAPTAMEPTTASPPARSEGGPDL